MLFKCVIVVFCVLSGRSYSMDNQTIQAEFSTVYHNKVRSGVQFTYWYNYRFHPSQNSTMRVIVNSSNAMTEIPILFVVRQQQAVVSWQIPLVLEDAYEYRTVSRTLCPLQNFINPNKMISSVNQSVSIDVSCSAIEFVDFSLSVSVIDDFVLRSNDSNPVHMQITPSGPQYFEYQFSSNVDAVLVHVTSDDMKCTVVSIQDIKCPIFDLDRRLEFPGMYQTMTRQAGITVQGNKFKERKFYVVLLLMSTDAGCSGVSSNQDWNSRRTKNVTVKITSSITKTEYYGAVFEAIGFFAIFYVLTLVISIVCYFRNRGNSPEVHMLDLSATNTDENNDAAILKVTSTSIDENNFDTDVDKEQNACQIMLVLYVADLAKGKEKILRKETKLYIWNLLTISIIYGVPVLQLVFTYQTILNITENEDICYYNFLCSYPLGVFSDFNHIFSNIGYIMLGILFLFLVWRRDRQYKKAVTSNSDLEKFYGIPQYFGLFYAMGLALIMEGILSGCYHVCPNYSNFQFDTAFMYLISGLCILKIYQKRHPDLNAHAYSAYLSFAIVVFVGALGILTHDSLIFWIIFTVAHVLCCLALSAQIYYMGRWKLNFGIFKRICSTLRNSCARPMYMKRLFLVMLANCFNWSWSLYGLIVLPKDFDTFLLAIFIFDLLLYLVFYVIMKLIHGEKILLLSLLYIVLSIVAWITACYFFLKINVTWQESPALSRESNKHCLLVDFYDSHDIWHFLSSTALFFSFMTLLTLDDDLVHTPRDKIPVF